jgi:hypothetical protein
MARSVPLVVLIRLLTVGYPFKMIARVQLGAGPAEGRAIALK